jgi:hypothetical protein
MKRGFEFEFRLTQVPLLWIDCHFKMMKCRLHISSYSENQECYNPPPNKKSRPEIRAKKDPSRGSEQSHTPYGKVKSGWRELRNSSLSQVASSSVWLQHCTLKNMIVLHRVTWSF